MTAASAPGAPLPAPVSSFAAGQLVAGRFRIVRLLARGGMGEVYEADDIDLSERVALKAIRPEIGEDERSSERFKREIQLARKVTHPNVCRTFDSVRHRPEGARSDIVLVTMELLLGETLSLRLDRTGAMAPEAALPLVEQMAGALQAAHAAGIVHRDFKSANVMLVQSGEATRVVVTDFGLARGAAIVGADSSAGQATSAFIGTPEYMAPEQIEGGKVTPAVDIYALGVVMYEMVTGARPFSGTTPIEVMVRRLKEPPQPRRQHVAGLDPRWEAVILRCLERDPEDRFASAADVVRALQAPGLSSAPTPRRLEAMTAPARRRAARRTTVALAVVAALATAFEAGRRLGRAAGGREAKAPSSFTQLTDLQGLESAPSLSPDGKMFVYVSRATGNADIYAQRVAGGAATNLTRDSPGDDTQPAFAPDGERIAFRSTRDGGGVFVMGSAGESVRRLSDQGYNPSWSPDGKEIAVSTAVWDDPMNRVGTGRLLALEVLTGKARVVYERSDAAQPSWSPHGQRIAFWGVQLESGSRRDLWTVAADGRDAKGGAVPLTDDVATDWDPVWSPDGRTLYFSSDRGGSMNLWRLPIDEASGRALGPPEPVTTPASWSADISFSKDGKHLAFATLDWRSSLQRVAFDAAKGVTVGTPQRFLSSSRPIRDHELSPDGQWVAFTRMGQQEDIFLARTDGSAYRRLTDDAFRDRGPAWSPDGKWIAFYSDRSGTYALWLIHPDGSGLQPLASVSGVGLNFPTWSPDGRRVVAPYSRGSWYLFDASHVPSEKTEGPMPAMAEGRFLYPMAWSRDGQWLAGPRLDRGSLLGGIARYSLATRRYEDLYDDPAMRFSTAVWLSDSRRLLVRDQLGILLLDAATKQARRLIPVAGFFVGRGLGITKDDRFITFTESASEGDVWLLELR